MAKKHMSVKVYQAQPQILLDEKGKPRSLLDSVDTDDAYQVELKVGDVCITIFSTTDGGVEVMVDPKKGKKIKGTSITANSEIVSLRLGV
jgi:hypothetical protein